MDGLPGPALYLSLGTSGGVLGRFAHLSHPMPRPADTFLLFLAQCARRLSVAIAVVLSAATGALAQTPPPAAPGTDQQQLTELPLEDLLKLKVNTVYAASKFEQEIAHAPASVSIITAQEIKNHGYRTLAEVLRNVRGFYVSYDRNYSYVGVRGFERPGDYNGRVLLLVNGHQLNDTIFEEALLGTESPLDVALFDRIEIIRGPSSSLYGTSAFFAVVNLITRTGRMLNGIEVEGQGGSQSSRTGRVTAGGRTAGGAEGLVSVSAFDSNGAGQLYFPEFDDPSTSGGVVRGMDGDRSINMFASAAAKGFQVQTGYGSRRKEVPTASFGTVFNDPRTHTRDARGFVDGQFTRDLPGRSTLQLGGSYDEYDYDGSYAYDTGLFMDGARGKWITAQADLIHRFDRHNVTLGLEYRKNLQQDQFASDETGPVLDDRRHQRTTAAFVEDEVRLSSHLIVNGGVRWDNYVDTFGGTVSPRVGVIFSPTELTTLKVLYGRAFRAPNPFELYYEGDPVSAALGPERIGTHEIVWEQRLTRRVELTSSVFHNRVRDLITQRSGSPDSIDGLYFVNSDGLDATGVELEVQAALPGGLRARIADAFQSSRDNVTNLPISNSPAQLVTIVLDAPLGRSGLVAGVNTYFVGERVTVRGTVVPHAWVSDLTVSAPWRGDRFTLALSAHNLFNASYGDPGSEEHRQEIIPQDGRLLALSATWRLR
jgi:outer membrane receptor protein involved in Fe transport